MRKQPNDGLYHAVVFSKTGHQEFEIPQTIVEDSDQKDFSELLVSHLATLTPGISYQFVPDPKFSEEILKFEESHPQVSIIVYKVLTLLEPQYNQSRGTLLQRQRKIYSRHFRTQ